MYVLWVNSKMKGKCLLIKAPFTMDTHECLIMQGQYCIIVIRLVLHVSKNLSTKRRFLGEMCHDEVSVETHVITCYQPDCFHPPSLGSPLPFKPTAQLQQTNHIVLSGILACFTAFHDLFCRHLFASSHSGSQESQWFLTSQFDKSGGYTLIPLIWPFSRALSQGEGDHRE